MAELEINPKVSGSLKDYFKNFGLTRDCLSWVWNEFINEKGKSFAKSAFVLTFFMFSIDIIRPYVWAYVFDGLNQRNSSYILWGLSVFSVLIFLGLILSYFRRKFLELIEGENARQLDLKTTELFLKKSLGLHIDENTILSKSNLERGYHRIQFLCRVIQYQGINSLLEITISFFAIFIFDWKSGVVVTVMLIIHIIWSLSINKNMIDTGVSVDKKYRALNRFRTELLDLVVRVKTNNKEESSLKKLSQRFEDFLVLDRKLWLWFIKMTGLRNFSDRLFLMIVLAWGILRIWQGELTLGMLYPLSAWTGQIMSNLWTISDTERHLNSAAPAVLSLKEALELPDPLTHSENPIILDKNSPCRITFDKVGYSYSGNGNKPVIADISLDIKSGEKVGVIGESGVGKSTMAVITLRNADPDKGSVKVDGKDLKEIGLGSWLDRVGYVPQSAQIFDGTIRENLLYGLSEEDQKKYPEEKLWEMVRLLQIDFGDRMVDGLDTKVGRNGIKLSGGQAQRIMIGAAVLKNPRFVILDEATSSLDATTEKWVQHGLERVLGDRGALIVTHRLNTIRRICDRFIFLDGNGEGAKIMAEASSFEELAKISPEFASLAKDQGIVFC
ncbi:MAG: ABC transporter ATP-binding protein [Patescibacteria group bacterium]